MSEIKCRPYKLSRLTGKCTTQNLKDLSSLWIAGLYYVPCHLYLQDAIEEFGVHPDGSILDEGSVIIVTHQTSPFTPDQFLQF